MGKVMNFGLIFFLLLVLVFIVVMEIMINYDKFWECGY